MFVPFQVYQSLSYWAIRLWTVTQCRYLRRSSWEVGNSKQQLQWDCSLLLSCCDLVQAKLLSCLWFMLVLLSLLSLKCAIRRWALSIGCIDNQFLDASFMKSIITTYFSVRVCKPFLTNMYEFLCPTVQFSMTASLLLSHMLSTSGVCPG